LVGFSALLGRNGARDVQLPNQIAERPKIKIEGRNDNKFVSTLPAFKQQARKRRLFGPESLAWTKIFLSGDFPK